MYYFLISIRSGKPFDDFYATAAGRGLTHQKTEDTHGGCRGCCFVYRSIILLHSLADQLHTKILTQRPTVQGEVVVGRHTPLAVGVEAVVIAAAVVLVLDALGNRLVGGTVLLQDPLGAVLIVSVNEDVEAVLAVAEDVVGATAHNDAGLLVGDVLDHLGLGLVELLVDRGVAVGARGAHGQLVQKAVGMGGVLLVLADELLRKSALAGHLGDELVVVKGDAHTLGGRLGNGVSAAAELTADGDDALFHSQASFVGVYQARICFSWVYYTIFYGILQQKQA